jgi:tRNA pseudouridine-54 N-methylase
MWQYHELQEAVQEFQARYYINEDGYLVAKVQELASNFYLGSGNGGQSPS